jgi:hypothetical protein
MAGKGLLEKVASAMALVCVTVVVSGTDACQENYSVGGQTSVTKTPATATPGGDATETGTITPTGTVTASSTETIAGTATFTPMTQSLGEIVPNEDSPSAGFFDELSALSDKDDEEAGSAPSKAAAGTTEKSANWLGGGFAKGSGVDQWQDADGDGFSDSTEESLNSDLNDANSVPQVETSNQLDSRVRESDPDMDGLANDQEAQRGTNPQLSDSDGDGKPDGAEVLSGSDPLNSSNLAPDADGDGLGDRYEENRGLNSKNMDSDSDGLRDDLEVVIGSNPLRVDSDGDGISDGKEFDLGSDPILGEPDRIQ